VGLLGERPIIGRPRSEAQLVVRLNQPLPSLVLQMRWILTLRHRKVGSFEWIAPPAGCLGRERRLAGGDERAFPGHTDNSRQAWLFRRLGTAPATTAEPISVTWPSQFVPSESRLTPFPFRPSLLGVATEVGMLFHGEIVSMMILRPAKALSTSRCTRSVSDFRNSCSALSSEISPSSSLIELEVRRATEDFILSARCSALAGRFGSSCSV
jgi:hypothetical protein